MYSCTTTIHLMRTVRVSPFKSCPACCTFYTDEYFIPMIRGPAIEQLDRGELDRFYVDSLPAPDPLGTDVAPMDFRPPRFNAEGQSVADYGAVV